MVPPILEFYHQIELIFGSEYKRMSEEEAANIGPPPEIWKNNGDELIYVKEIQDIQQIHCLIACWRRTVKEYRALIRSRRSKTDLRSDLKATIWLAGFPISNKEVIFGRDIETAMQLTTDRFEVRNYQLLDTWYRDEQSKDSMVRDFVGSQMDTGFRLAQLSTPRKCMVSIETAFFLVMETPPRSYDRDLSLYFDGTGILRGVLGGRPYPLFWIDMADKGDISRIEDELVGRANVPERSARDYCHAFFDAHEDHILKPFRVSSPKDDLRQMPPYFASRLKHIAAICKKEADSLALERQAGLTAEAPEAGNDEAVIESPAAEEFISEIPLSDSRDGA